MAIGPPAPITQPQAVSSAGGLVIAKFNDATGMAESAFSIATNALGSLAAQQYQIAWAEPTWIDVPTLGLEGLTAARPVAPLVPDIAYDPATFDGTKPSSTGVDGITISNEALPAYTDSGLTVDIPTKPSVVWPEFSKDAPSTTTIEVPTAPGYNLPPVPTLTGVSIPASPSYNDLQFEGQLPVEDLTPPNGAFNWLEEVFSHKVLTKLEDEIYAELVAGGAGFPEATEQAIYDRAVARLEEEAETFLESSLNRQASRGFPLPPGAIDGILLETHNKILRAKTDINNDILVQQTKLAQENAHFTKTIALNLTQVLMQNYNAVQQRSFEAAKYVLEYALQTYAVKVEAYKAKLEGYKALAQVFVARIQGEIAKAELYKAQIEGAKINVEVQRNVIELYTAQVNTIKILMEAYRTEMEGANIQAQIDSTRLQGYLYEVQAFVAKTNAVTSRYEGYKAEIAGEAVKVDAIQAHNGSYLARIQGYKAKSEVDIARAQAELMKLQGNIDIYKTDLMKYSEDTKAKLAQLEADVRVSELDIELYKADTQSYAVDVDGLSKTYLGMVEEAKAKSEVEVKAAELSIRSLLGQYELAMETVKGIAAVAGQLAAAAMGSVNASAAIGHQEARSDSTGFNNSNSANESFNASLGIASQHIYQYET